MRIHHLKRSMSLPHEAREVFEFFADARNLEAITPPWLHFAMLTAPGERMAVGTRLDYRLRVRGMPLRWTSLITAWDPPRRFIDLQISGPYRFWEHEHRFEGDGRWTTVRDHVRYAVPGGALVQRLVVAPELRRIFDYRRDQLARLLDRTNDAADPDDPHRIEIRHDWRYRGAGS